VLEVLGAGMLILRRIMRRTADGDGEPDTAELEDDDMVGVAEVDVEIVAITAAEIDAFAEGDMLCVIGKTEVDGDDMVGAGELDNGIVALTAAEIDADAEGEILCAVSETESDGDDLAGVGDFDNGIAEEEIAGDAEGDIVGVLEVDIDIAGITVGDVDRAAEGDALGDAWAWAKISSTSIPEMNALSDFGTMRISTIVALVFVTLYEISYGLKPPPALANTSTSPSASIPWTNTSNTRAPTRNSPRKFSAKRNVTVCDDILLLLLILLLLVFEAGIGML